MKLNIERPIWALALICSLLLLAYQCEQKKNDKLNVLIENQQLAQDTARLQATIRDSTARLSELRSERVTEHLKFEASTMRLNASVRHWKGEARKVRPVVVELSDSIPVLKAYIQATDSVIAGQDSVIQVQSMHLVSQAKLYELEISTMAGRHIQQQQLTELWKTTAVDRETKLKRSEKRKRFWKGAALVLGATTAVLVLAK